MQLIQKISIDFSSPGIPEKVYGKQDDSGSRVVEISLFNSGVAFPVPADAIMLLRYKTAQGSIGFYDTMPNGEPALCAANNTVTVQLVDQIFALPGRVEAELRIVDNVSGVSTWTFYVDVENSKSGDATVPSDYINVFTGVAAQVAADASRAESAASRAESAAGSVDGENIMGKNVYDPTGTVEAAGGIAKYVNTSAPKTTVVDSVTSTSTTDAASAASVKRAYDKAQALDERVGLGSVHIEMRGDTWGDNVTDVTLHSVQGQRRGYAVSASIMVKATANGSVGEFDFVVYGLPIADCCVLSSNLHFDTIIYGESVAIPSLYGDNHVITIRAKPNTSIPSGTHYFQIDLLYTAYSI